MTHLNFMLHRRVYTFPLLRMSAAAEHMHTAAASKHIVHARHTPSHARMTPLSEVHPTAAPARPGCGEECAEWVLAAEELREDLHRVAAVKEEGVKLTYRFS